MGVTIVVKFADTSGTFYPGQFIQGKVTLQNDTEILVKGLILTFFGDAEIYWTESEVRFGTTPTHHHRLIGSNQRGLNRHVQREYRNQETFLCDEVVLFGQSDDENDEQIKLDPGSRDYFFNYQLPSSDLPSTFTDLPYGSIKYTLDARLKRPLFRYYRVEKEFFVNGILDLNFVPSTLEPFGVNKRKDFGWICCPNGYITVDLRLNKTGHLPTESVHFTVSVLNLSRVGISNIHVTFWQVIDFITFDRKKTVTNDLKTFQIAPSTDLRTLAEWSDSFQLPENLLPTTLSGCRIIRINYKLEGLVKLTCGTKMNISVPIIIGTEPCPPQEPIQFPLPSLNNHQNEDLYQRPGGVLLQNESYQSKPVETTEREYNPALNPFDDDFVGEVEATETANVENNNNDDNNDT